MNDALAALNLPRAIHAQADKLLQVNHGHHRVQCGAAAGESFKASCDMPTTSGPSSLFLCRSASELSSADFPCFRCFTKSVTQFVSATP